MINELIFFLYLIAISASAYIGLRLGPGALVALMSLLGVLANLFVSKQIMLFSLAATASDALAVGVTLSLNLTQEFFGKAAARSAIYASFFCLVAYTLFSKLHLLYIPHVSDTMQHHFGPILSSMPRITIASLFTFFVVQNLDALLYGFTQKKLPGLPFVLRNFLCISITQFIDTILFSFLGLYGIVSNIGQLIVVSYSIKLITILLLVPLVKLAIKNAPTEKKSP